MSSRCETCGGWSFGGHKCDPLFTYNIPEMMDDEWRETRALSHVDAAENACEENDRGSGEYSIMHYEGTNVVRVRDAEGVEKRFSIVAEPVPTYYATEIIDSADDPTEVEG